ncbi:MAG: hypothetical protein H7Y27_07715 [Gemmatimonadaceae bacterium]|nr:hypothetical protein [Chitinophagaceae bacterium]
MQQRKLIGIILTVMGIVGASMTAVPYLGGKPYGYDEDNVNTFGFISTALVVAGIILLMISTSETKRTAR